MFIAIIIFEFIILFPIPKDFSPLIILVPILIIFINILSKKIAAPFFNIEIEHGVWEFQRWGYYKRSHLNKPFPMGAVFSPVLTFFTLGLVKPLVFLQFTYKNIPELRMLKQRGTKRKLEINDSDIGFTAAWGFLALLVLAFIGALVNFPELAKYPVYYGIWNLIPFGKLDGSRLFFGSILSYALIVFFYLISLVLVILYLW